MTLQVTLRCALALCASICLILTSAGHSIAQTRVERVQAAGDLVDEALHREVYGEGDDREALLNQALALAPEFEAAHWHMGHVKEKGKWINFETAAAAAQLNSQLAEYRRRRDDAEDTVAGHLALADWCREKDLDEQQRAHLFRVIELAPDHADARRRLGHIQVQGEWLTVEQRREEFQRLVEGRTALAKWIPKMREIARGLTRRGKTQREAAEEKLRAIGDPLAIGAMEAEICPLGVQASRMVVEVIGNMKQHEASLALARHAVFSPHSAVREEACTLLKHRRQDAFVPPLLSQMQTPVVSRSQLYRGRGGSLVCRQVMQREGQDRRDLAVLETEYQRVARIGGDRNDTLARALSEVQRTVWQHEIAVSRENSQTAALNQRVMNVLEQSTGEVLPPTPQDWWSWWNQQNEVFVATDKPLRQRYDREQVALVDRTPLDSGTPTGGSTSDSGITQFTSGRTCDCLAAGTRVWTELGPQAIETIQVGDRVLAQDPETGELAYKPVLGTTIRPASRLLRIEAGQDAITTSGGHPYWASGSGWQKARELKSGAELHAVQGTVRVSRVEEAEFAPTYNLIVADFHSYFVGSGLVLCHDNTIRQPTNALVPGLSDY